MNGPQDPARLREPGGGAPARLQELFAEAAGEQPTAAQLSHLEAKLAPLLAADPAPPRVPPSSDSLRLVLKLGVGALVVGGAALVILSAREKPADDAASASAVAAVSHSPLPSAAAAAAAVGSTPPTASAPAPESVAPAVPAPPAASAAVPSRSVRAASGLPEDRLLEQARAALSRDPALALALTREHQQRFSAGVLTQEREVIAIEALRRLGRTAEADRRTERFEQRYPGSAHQRKLDAPSPPR